MNTGSSVPPAERPLDTATHTGKTLVFLHTVTSDTTDDLAARREAVHAYCAQHGYSPDGWIEYIQGLNGKRRHTNRSTPLCRVTDPVEAGNVRRVIFATSAAISPLSWLLDICERHGAQVLFVDGDTLEQCRARWEEERAAWWVAWKAQEPQRMQELAQHEEVLMQAIEAEQLRIWGRDEATGRVPDIAYQPSDDAAVWLEQHYDITQEEQFIWEVFYSLWVSRFEDYIGENVAEQDSVMAEIEELDQFGFLEYFLEQCRSNAVSYPWPSTR